MKFELDKSSKKFVCPNCNKKRFVRFVEIDANTYLDEIYGRCDRESSCGYYIKPTTDMATNINYTNKNLPHKNYLPLKSIDVASYHTTELLQKSLQQFHKNNFHNFLKSVFALDKIEAIFKKYQIGTSKAWEGSTVFWQIDNYDKIRAGKIILFDKNTCKRVKEPYPHITWVHSKLKQNPFILKQCLFGLHLANDSDKIAIIESEKTAVIMSLFLPEYAWLATGSKQNFKKELLLSIKDKEIIAFPDKGEFNDWQQKASVLNKTGYNIKVSDYLEKMDCEAGTDLADIYISLKNNKPNIEDLSRDEKEIVRLAKENPNLLKLIETFDLLDSFDNTIEIEILKMFL